MGLDKNKHLCYIACSDPVGKDTPGRWPVRQSTAGTGSRNGGARSHGEQHWTSLESGATPFAADYYEHERGRIMNEIVQLITTLISNVGFPIACVCYLFYSQQKEREAHAIESKAWVDALDRNTQVMERLEGKLSTHKEG